MSEAASHEDRHPVSLLALFLLAAVVRARLTYDGGIWADEGLVFNIVNIPSWKDMISFIGNHESHPPLFYVLVRAWRAIVGAADGATLALPAILGALIVPASFFVGRQLYSARVG